MDLGWGEAGGCVLEEEMVWGLCVRKRLGELGEGVGMGEGAEEG